MARFLIRTLEEEENCRIKSTTASAVVTGGGGGGGGGRDRSRTHTSQQRWHDQTHKTYFSWSQMLSGTIVRSLLTAQSPHWDCGRGEDETNLMFWYAYLARHLMVRSRQSLDRRRSLLSASTQQLHIPPMANSIIFSSFSSAITSEVRLGSVVMVTSDSSPLHSVFPLNPFTMKAYSSRTKVNCHIRTGWPYWNRGGVRITAAYNHS